MSERILGGAVVATALVVVPVPGAEPGLQSALKLAVLAGAALLVVVAGHPRRDALATTTSEWWLGALAAGALASAALGPVALTTSAPLLISLLCAFVLVRAARGQADRLGPAIAWACAGVVAVASLELLGLDLPWTWDRRPESTLGNRNHVAEYLIIALPVLVARAAAAAGPRLRGAGRDRRAALVLVTAVVAVIVATRCRTAYLAGGAALAVTLACHAHAVPHRRVVLAALLGVALGALPWPGVSFRASAGDALTRVFTVDGSGQARVEQHQRGAAAMTGAHAAILGAGPGGWAQLSAAHAHASGAHAPRSAAATVPNSEWLRTLTEQGALGVALLVGFAIAAIGAARRDPDRARRTTRLATLAAVGVVGTFDPLLARPELVVLLAVLLAGPTCALTALSPPRRVGRWALVVAASAATALALLRGASFAASTAGHEAWAATLWPRPQLLERQAQRLARRGDCRAAEATLTRVGPTGTYAWGPRLAVARCYARTSATSDARRMWHAALAIEPHLRALVNPAPERP
jgi:hypothetical protein